MPYLATSIFQPLTTKITNFLSIILQEDKKKNTHKTTQATNRLDAVLTTTQSNIISLTTNTSPYPATA
jgi:preprotein translocase subunit SecY